MNVTASTCGASRERSIRGRRDPVLTEYKFTNAFRAADRVSQYLIELVYSDPDASADTLFLRTLLFKTFNKIDTWKGVVGNLGMPVAPGFDYEACEILLDNYRRDRISIYSGAYIMPSGGRSGAPKHRMHLHLIRRMLDDDLPGRLRETESLAEAYELLLTYPTLGPFLAFQYAVDLNYTTLMNHSERDFVVAGPGALDGLSKCFESLGDYSPEDTIVWLSDMQMEEFSRHNLDFDGLWGRPLQPIDVQNLLCEVSKYTRATHPNVKGRSGRKRIKQKFRMTGTLPEPVFPPKWGLKQKVAAWLESTRVKDTERAQNVATHLLPHLRTLVAAEFPIEHVQSHLSTIVSPQHSEYAITLQDRLLPLPERRLLNFEAAHEFLDGLEQIVVNVIDAPIEFHFLGPAEHDCRYRLFDDTRPCAILIFIQTRIALPLAVQ